MSITTISQWSTTPTSNTDLNGYPLAENVMRPSDVNNAFQNMMAQIKAGSIGNAGYATTATAAGTTTLTVASPSWQFFTGTTTQTVVLPVTSTLTLGTAYRIVNDSTGVVTVQSSGANEVVALQAGTAAIVTCILISGTTAASWSIQYVPVTANANATSLTVTSTDAGASANPILDLYRNSASPAVNDVLGQLIFNGKDSAANKQEYASIQAVIADPVSGSEDGGIDIYNVVAGARNLALPLSTGSGTGTWTPTIAFGGSSAGITYSLQQGIYIKIGRLVFISARLAMTSNGSGSGAATLTGLPFTSAATYISTLSFGYWGGTSGVVGNLVARVEPSTTTASVAYGGATAITTASDTTLPDGSDIIFSGCYTAAA
jgi:hypothetical protein